MAVSKNSRLISIQTDGTQEHCKVFAPNGDPIEGVISMHVDEINCDSLPAVTLKLYVKSKKWEGVTSNGETKSL